MTAITSSNTTISTNELIPPLKVALAGLTMIQQSLLEFYFETQEGKRQYTQVLRKDADAYITNFDENGSTEAWDNLYAHEKKPTLVLSHRHETIDNFIYIPKPITPTALENAVISLNKLLNNTLSTPSSDFLQFSVDPQKNTTVDTPPPIHEESIAILPTTTTNPHEDIKKELDELLSFEEQKIPQNQESFSGLEMLDELSLQNEEETDNPIPSFEETINIEDINIADIATLEKPEEQDDIEEISITIAENPEEVSLAVIKNSEENAPLSSVNNPKEEAILNNDTPSDDLETLLSELTEEDAKQKEQSAKKDKPLENQNTKEEKRWNILCGEYDDISYKINTAEEIHFKATNTLLPYLKDTIDFSKRSNCWMEVSYKCLSVIIDPENKCIYSNISLEDKNFISLCVKNIDEDQVELEEVDEQGITQFKQKNINKKYLNYSFDSFLWTTSLTVSHGRLPKNINPDNRISINNWLSLKEVEKFPHIMQIAAVFNQHNASLNEVATWMNLPKRYVYSFYNGVEALGMIEQDSEKSNKESLITMMKEEKESTLKKILFTKIM